MQIRLLDLLEMVGNFEERKDAFRKIYLSKLSEPEDFERTLEDIARYRGRKYRKELENIYLMVVEKLLNLLNFDLEVEGLERSGRLVSRKLDMAVSCFLLSPWKRPKRIPKEYRNNLMISFSPLPSGVFGITWRGLVAALKLKKVSPDFDDVLHMLVIARDLDGVLSRLTTRYISAHTRKPWNSKEATSVLAKIRSEQIWTMLRILAEHPEGLKWEEIKEKFRERTGQEPGKRGFPAIAGVVSRLSEGHEPIIVRNGERYILHPAFAQIIREKEAERR